MSPDNRGPDRGPERSFEPIKPEFAIQSQRMRYNCLVQGSRVKVKVRFGVVGVQGKGKITVGF